MDVRYKESKTDKQIDKLKTEKIKMTFSRYEEKEQRLSKVTTPTTQKFVALILQTKENPAGRNALLININRFRQMEKYFFATKIVSVNHPCMSFGSKL